MATKPIQPYKITFNYNELTAWLAKVGSIEKASDILKIDARNIMKLMLKYGKDT